MSEPRGLSVPARSLVLSLVPLLVGGCSADAEPAVAQDWRTVTSVRRASGEEALRVEVEYGIGELSITPAAGDMLYRARLRYDANTFEPEIDYESGELHVGIDGDDGVNIRGDEAGELALELGTGVPLTLDLKFGAVEANLELGGLHLHDVSIATGASETTLRFSHPNPVRMESLEVDAGAAAIRLYGLGNANAERFSFEGGMADVLLDFGGAWRANASARIAMGLGSVTVRVPRNIGVSIQKSSFFASFDADGFVSRGSEYFSANWDDAEYRLEIDVDSALGSVDIDWIDAAVSTTMDPRRSP
ncbi:MAG: toast rack family protein [Longimicrobiales bacterium]